MSEQNGTHQAYFGLTTDQLTNLAQRVAERLPLERFALDQDAINTIAQAVQDKLVTMRTMDTLAAAMGRTLTGVNLTLTDKAIARVADDIRAGVAAAVVKVDAEAFAHRTVDLLRADPLRVTVEATQATKELERLRPLAQFLDHQQAEQSAHGAQLIRRAELLDDREKALDDRERHVTGMANAKAQPMTTAELAAALGQNPESIRTRLSMGDGRSYYGVRPEKNDSGQWRWPADTLAQLERAGIKPKPKPATRPAPAGPVVYVDQLGLSVAAVNILRAGGFETLDAIPRDAQTLLKMPNMGRRRLNEVLQAIERHENGEWAKR